MRVQYLMIALALLACGCLQEDEPRLEYQCWDGTIVPDLEYCPPTTLAATTSTTTTTSTTLECFWTEESCRMYCSKECGSAPLLRCELDAAVCECDFECGKVATTTSTTTTTTTLSGWLKEREVDSAIEWGVENRFKLEELLEEYAYPNYSVGYEHVIIYTPYLNLALAAADRAREYRSLSDAEIAAINSDDQIKFKVKVYGDTREFPENINAVIKRRGDIIHPVETEYDTSTETTNNWPSSPAYFGVNTYVFDDYGEIKDKKISFTVIKVTGEEEYEIDLEDYP